MVGGFFGVGIFGVILGMVVVKNFVENNYLNYDEWMEYFQVILMCFDFGKDCDIKENFEWFFVECDYKLLMVC